jgi:hypothetical protein
MLSCRRIAGGLWWMGLRGCRWVIDSTDRGKAYVVLYVLPTSTYLLTVLLFAHI